MANARGATKLRDSPDFMTWWQNIHHVIENGVTKTITNCELNPTINVDKIAYKSSRTNIEYYCDYCLEKHITTPKKFHENRTLCEKEREGVPRIVTDRTPQKYFKDFKGTDHNNKLKIDSFLRTPVDPKDWNPLWGDEVPNNGNFQFDKIAMTTSKMYWFHCNRCNHYFKTQISYITREGVGGNTWCPYCCIPQQKLCAGDCSFCYDNSILHYEEIRNMEIWSFDKKIDKKVIPGWTQENPHTISRNSNLSYYFRCKDPECGHVLSKTVGDLRKSNLCGFCAGRKELCPASYNCEPCIKKSFARYSEDGGKTISPKVKLWCLDNPKRPEEVYLNSHDKYRFNCMDCKNNFNMCINDIAQRNSWCPICINKTERKLLEWLKDKKYTVEFQRKYEWCKGEYNRHYIYDFVINNKVIVELDGNQHFEQISNWKSPEDQNKIDRVKIKKALENNMSIIHIFQPDIYENKNDWENKLYLAINELLELSTPQFTLIGVNEKHFTDI
jgi:very-short-patch-repair endonuclease